jgi:alpha-N-arabinofuranosidase
MTFRSFSLPKTLALTALLSLNLFATAPQAKEVEPKGAVPAAGYWPLDEGSGNATSDASGHGMNGVLKNGAWSSAARIGQSALDLNGRGSVDVSDSVLDTSRSFTVSAWVKFKNATGYQTIISVDGEQVSGFFLQLQNTGKFGFVRPEEDRVGAPIAAATSLNQVDPNVWYHLVGVYDAKAKTIGLYVNGTLQDKATFNKPWRASAHLQIGRGKYAGNPTDFASALIDDVHVYQGVHVDPAEMAHLQSLNPTQPSILTINAAQNGAKISPLMYGSMLEDIGHSIDGGLYAELIQNRAFKDDAKNPVHWSVVRNNTSSTITLDATHPVPNTALTSSLRLESKGAGAGIANDGFWGIPVTPQTKYRASFYAHSDGSFNAPLTVSLQSNDGASTFATATVRSISSEWKKYTVTLTTSKSAPRSHNNRFVIRAGGAGTLWFSQVSLFPPTFNNRPNGTRIDLMKHLVPMKPTFLRLPGGGFLQGNTIAERFDWKKTIGPIEQRPGHPNPRGYRSSDGFGLLEYFQLCEDLEMEPVLAVFAGYSLGHEHVKAGPELQPFVQDALDEVEYLIGGTNTKWGARRAADGHPKPFALRYVEIGNEDWFDTSGSYESRYAAFHDALKAKYPHLQLIGTRNDIKSRRPDLIDDHYYWAARAFQADWKRYDSITRQGPKIIVGGYGSQEGIPTPNLKGALGDAAIMAGLERNADLVQLSSYAPLLVNVNPGASQPSTSLIGFDALNSYVSPGYYTQKLFSLYHGDTVVPATIVPASMEHGGALSYVASKASKTGTLYVKVVNPLSEPIPMTIVLNDVKSVAPEATAIVLSSANDTDTNTITEPNKVAPISSQLKGVNKTFKYTFKPNSLSVLILSVK